MKCEECGKAIIDEEMSDRWKIEIVDINAQPTILRACPNVEVMTDYVQKTIDELNRRLLMAEEQMIFESSPDSTLERIRDVCDQILRSRRESKID